MDEKSKVFQSFMTDMRDTYVFSIAHGNIPQGSQAIPPKGTKPDIEDQRRSSR